MTPNPEALSGGRKVLIEVTFPDYYTESAANGMAARYVSQISLDTGVSAHSVAHPNREAVDLLRELVESSRTMAGELIDGTDEYMAAEAHQMAVFQRACDLADATTQSKGEDQ